MRNRNLFLTTISSIMFSIASIAQVPSNGLIGWWPFNGNANDESGNNNHGVVYGAILTTDRFGSVDSAFAFDGISDSILVSNDTSQLLQGSGTWACWVAPASYDTTGVISHSILSKYDFNLNLREFVLELTDGFILMNVRDSNNAMWHTVMSNDTINLGVWKHLVATYDKNQSPSLKLYN